MPESVDYTQFATDGCITDGGAPMFSVMEDQRALLFDKFGQIVSDIEDKVITVKCTLDACLPPTQGTMFYFLLYFLLYNICYFRNACRVL